MNNFQVASTARRPGQETDPETSGHLFVGELMPHNAERPWLSIRATASVALAKSEPAERPPAKQP